MWRHGYTNTHVTVANNGNGSAIEYKSTRAYINHYYGENDLIFLDNKQEIKYVTNTQYNNKINKDKKIKNKKIIITIDCKNYSNINKLLEKLCKVDILQISELKKMPINILSLHNLQVLDLKILTYSTKKYCNVGLMTNLKYIHTNYDIVGVHLLHYIKRITINSTYVSTRDKTNKRFINEVIKLLDVRKNVRIVFNYARNFFKKNKLEIKFDKYFSVIKTRR